MLPSGIWGKGQIHVIYVWYVNNENVTTLLFMYLYLFILCVESEGRQAAIIRNIFSFRSAYYLFCLPARGGYKDSVGGVKIFSLAREARRNFFYPPLEKYHDVYQIIGFNWV